MKEVLIVTSCCITFIIFCGSAYDTLQTRKNVKQYAPCSVDIKNMALELNVTLLGECEVSK